MSTRTANWVSRTTPGTAPPPPSRAASTPAPPTIYPESSVSNPNASRYAGRSSRSASHSYPASRARSNSMGGPPPSSHHSSSRAHARSNSASHHSSHYSTGSHRVSSHGSPVVPVNTYYASPQEPIIARTSGADGRTGSYMIIPAKGQRVEILHPTVARPTSSSSSYSTSSSRYTSPTKETPLYKKLFGKLEWGDKGSSASSSTSARSSRTRRNSSGESAAGWTVVSGGSGTRVISSGGRVISTGGGGGSRSGTKVVYV